MSRRVTFGLVLLILSGCGASNQELQFQIDGLSRQNSDLTLETNARAQRISSLETSVESLEHRRDELMHQRDQARVERDVRYEEASRLRSQVRVFWLQEKRTWRTFFRTSKVELDDFFESRKIMMDSFFQARADTLDNFNYTAGLQDFVGEELIPRGEINDRNQLLVDIENRILRDGSLLGVAGVFNKPGQFRVRILRPDPSSSPFPGYLTLPPSQMFTVTELGEQRFEFAGQVGVRKNDLIAYEFPGAVLIVMDKGVGGTCYVDLEKLEHKTEILEKGGVLSSAAFLGLGDDRAYSIGVYAVLDVEVAMEPGGSP